MPDDKKNSARQNIPDGHQSSGQPSGGQPSGGQPSNGQPSNGRQGRRGPHAGGPMGQFMPGQKARDFGGSMKKLISYLGEHKAVIILVLALTVASTVLTIIGPKVMGGATDELFNGLMRKLSGTGGVDFAKIGTILLQLVGLYVISIILSYFQGWVMTGVSMKISYKLRNDISEKIHRLPLRYFDTNTHGDVLSRITNDVDTLSQTLNQSLAQLIMSFTSVIGIIIMMLTISPLLTLVSLLILPLSTVFIMMIVKRSQKLFMAQQESLGSLNGHIEEMFGNHVIVKAFNGEEASIKAFDKNNDELYNSNWKANFLSGLMFPVIGFVSNLGYVAICIIGGALAASGSMTVGGIQAFIQYMRQFSQPISQVANTMNILQQTAAAAERVFEFLDEEEEPADVPGAIVPAASKGKVEFKNVSFGYEEGKTVIRNFTASVSPGKKIAIVGPTGAGKTTIVKLLMRFYDVNGGEIIVDGTEIRKYTRDGLRSLFGMVLQDTWLFNGTIEDNIRYGKLNATDEELKKAAKAAQAHYFIRTLPESYRMRINEEADNISAGQKQLLTIARSILADPEILILDEATSNVDTRTEVLIQRAMDNLMEGRTSFIIAHRLSTIRSADLILVMRDGDIAEQGTHEELLARGGFYADLYNSQFDTES